MEHIDTVGGFSYRDQVQEHLLFSAHIFRDRIFQLIDGSKSEILLSTYIFESDNFGSQVFERLTAAARRGVRVKICVDGYGSLDWFQKKQDDPHCPGLEIRGYHPVPWPIFHFDQFIRLLYHFNYRNHQKLWLFDRKVAILGSRNVNDDALAWRETSIEIQEPEVESLCNMFQNLWERSHTLDMRRRKAFALKALPMPSAHYFSSHFWQLRKKRNETIRGRLENAQKKILITTPYFLPQRKTLKGLCHKAKHGVEIQILLPGKTDVRISKWLAQSTYRTMLDAGIRIFEYQDDILHAKTLIVDDWALVGSSNFNQRSAIRDLELDYAPQNRSTHSQLMEQFNEDKLKSKEIFSAPKNNLLVNLVRGIVARVFQSWF